MKTQAIIIATALLAACAPLAENNGAYGYNPIEDLHRQSMNRADEIATQATKSIGEIGEVKTIEASIELVKYHMKDPDSTRFRNVRIQRHGMTEHKIVCGEVNSKNSYGGYVGFVKFIASPTDCHAEDTSGDVAVRDAANAGLDRTCYR